ncbi:PREDICTED: V-type proton ATPase subunit G 1-like [Odobenus rosmarus divergens]|uniref:V-type proton ATPase subunit G n=1 Tax=Odobenus rosmarus divergens TaxID=9708 RepID=A0A9B0GKT4_ODORO
MASQSQGIQQLLQAEKRAAEKVSEARKRKNRRLKQAKEAAQAEIEQYRLQREKEFKAKEAAALGSHGSCSTEVEKETQEKKTILQAYYQQNRDEVLDNLLAFVCDIRPEIHENYRINGKGRKEQLCVQIGMFDAVMEYEASAKLE